MQAFVSTCFRHKEVEMIGKNGADAALEQRFCCILGVNRVTQHRYAIGPRLGQHIVTDMSDIAMQGNGLQAPNHREPVGRHTLE